MSLLESPAEIAAMLASTGGVEVIYGNQNTWGHHEVIAEEGLTDGTALVAGPSVVIASHTLQELEQGAEIEVGGATYMIREWGAGPAFATSVDGSLTRILLGT